MAAAAPGRQTLGPHGNALGEGHCYFNSPQPPIVPPGGGGEGPGGGAGIGGPYFTKYSEDHWVSSSSDGTLHSAVMFKDKEYPSASAALEAYIQQHEGRPGTLLPPTARPVEAVEELLIPHVMNPTSSSRGAAREPGFVDQVQAQRIKALKKMVDEAYERLEAHGHPSRGAVATQQGQGVSAANKTLTESQRVLTCISSLPGAKSSIVTEGSMSTEALLNAKPQYYPAPSTITGASPSSRKGYKTMQDYVEEARKAGIVDSSLLSEFQRPRAGSDPHVIGSTAKPTVLTLSPSSPGRQNFRANGGRSPPDWVKDLNGSTSAGAGASRLSNSSPVRDHLLQHTNRQSRHYHQYSAIGQQQRHQQQPMFSKDDMYLLASTAAADVNGLTSQHYGRVDASSRLIPTGGDSFSLTTDDLVYASPDGRSLSAAKLRSLDLSLTPAGRRQQQKGAPALEEAGADGGGPSFNLLCHMRRDFADKLLQEVDDGPSSIVTAYPSPILAGHHHRGGAAPVSAPPPGADVQASPAAYSPGKLRTLGLLTPETERLLRDPPRLGAMPGYVPSPIAGLSSHTTPPGGNSGINSTGSSDTPPVVTTEQVATRDLLAGETVRDLSVDFTERVRALLLAPPGGDQTSEATDGAGSNSLLNIVEQTQLTDDILDGEREWEKQQPAFKGPKHIKGEYGYGPKLDSKEKRSNIVDSFLKECLDETDKEKCPTLSGPHQQPGSMEALKNMLFKVQSMAPPPSSVTDDPNLSGINPLQLPQVSTEQAAADTIKLAVEADFNSVNSVGGDRVVVPTTLQEVDTTEQKEQTAGVTQKSVRDFQHLATEGDSFDEQAGTESLQRAMLHLGRLKSLVKESK